MSCNRFLIRRPQVRVLSGVFKKFGMGKIHLVKNHQLKLVALVGSGFACPPLADNFIYEFIPVELRWIIKNLSSNSDLNNYRAAGIFGIIGTDSVL